jgi:phage-related baseplate assembly protein
MAILPVSRLIRPLTRDEVMSDLIVIGDALQLRTSSWRGFGRWTLIALSEIGSRASNQIAAIASHSYNDTAWGFGLTRLSRSQFDNERASGIRTRGILEASDVGSVGPVTWPARTRTFSPQGALSGFKFTNVADVTINLDAVDVAFTVEALVIGAGYNSVGNDADWDISPVYAGIEIANPANDTGPASNWLTTLGTDQQTDAILRLANQSKWATLSGNSPSAAYEFWALSAVDVNGDNVGITRVLVPEPPGDGTLIVYIATADGVPDGSQVTAVQDYIDARKPVTAVPTVTAASTVAVNVTVTVTMRAGAAVTEQDVEDAISAVVNGTPIGGTPDGGNADLIHSELIYRIRDLSTDIIKVVVSAPASDVEIDEDEIAVTGTLTVTLVEI